MSEVTINKNLDYLKNLKIGDAEYNSIIQKLYMQIYQSKKLILNIEKFVDQYTFDETRRECGYRSIIDIFLIAASKAVSACDKPHLIFKPFYSKKRHIK